MTTSTLRELMFQISEIDETKNPFRIALNMTIALKNNQISNEQFELLAGDLFKACKIYNIETSNEICSLF